MSSARKWKKGQLEKFRASMAARAEAKAEGNSPKGSLQKDAILYLRHAEADIQRRLKDGKLKKMDHAHLLAMLALAVLQGE